MIEEKITLHNGAFGQMTDGEVVGPLVSLDGRDIWVIGKNGDSRIAWRRDGRAVHPERYASIQFLRPDLEKSARAT